MKKIIKITFFVLFISTLAFGGEYVVVANKKMQDVSKSQIKAIFLKKLTLLGETKVVAVNLDARDDLRLKFEKELLHMGFSRLKAYWTKQHYLGHRPPITLKSVQSVKAFVKKVDGAIGYMDVNNLDDDLKVIYRWSE